MLKIQKTMATFVFFNNDEGAAEAARVAELIPDGTTIGLSHQKLRLSEDGFVPSDDMIARVAIHKPKLLREITVNYKLETDIARPQACPDITPGIG